MKLLASLFVTQAIAFSMDTRSPALISRQAAADITSSIAAIQSATQSLNTAISSGDLLALASGNTAVVNAIKTATSEANGLSTLSFDDAAGLAQPIQDLGKVVDSTITNLISKKDSLAGVREAVLSGLKDQQAASMTFSTTLLSKIPANLQGIASNLAQPIADSLARGIAAYSGSSSGSGAGASQTPNPAATQTTTAQGSVVPSAAGSNIPGNNGAGYVMPTLSTVTGIPSYSLPGSTPTAPPATYTGAAASLGQAGVGAFAAGVVAAMAAL